MFIELFLTFFSIFLTSLIIIYFPNWLFKKVDKKSLNHGGDVIAKFLKENHVEFVFTLCGGHISPILAAAEKQNIRVIDVRDEATAVFAADAAARLKGTIGVSIVTAGPGLTNTITALKNAQMAESPVLLISGAAPGLTKNRGALQDIDQISLVKSICKYVASINNIRDAPKILRKATKAALSDVPGPVFIEIPIDVLYPYNIVEEQLKIPKNPKSILGKIIKTYMNLYMKYVFAGAFDNLNRVCEPVKQDIPLPNLSKVAKVADMIKSSKRPLMVLGSQTTLSTNLIDNTIESIKKLGIPVYTSGMARGILGAKHDLLFRHNRKNALKEADLIILAGAVCDFRLDYGRAMNPKAKIVTINRSKKNMQLNSDIFWKPAIKVESDVSRFLIELAKISETADASHVSDWFATLKEREEKRNAEIIDLSNQPTNNYNNPMKILLALDQYGIQDDDIIVVDGGDFVGTASYILRPRGPLKWLDPGAFGALGVGAGFAIGAKLSMPKANVWLIYGDGSCGYSISEWDTMTRHKIPAIGVIGNDAGWSQISRDQTKILGTNVACGLAHTPYHTISSSYSSAIDNEVDQETGFIYLKDDVAELKRIFRECLSLSQKSIPSMINCIIGKTSFREGSISC